MFWFVSAILIAIAILFLFSAFTKRTFYVDATRDQNILIAKEQLTDLEKRLAEGEINSKSYQMTREELELSLFDDLKGLETEKQAINDKSIVSYWVLLLIPVITIPLYLNLGSIPTDPKGWYMLGRSYMLLKRYPEAAKSFEKSLAIRPDLAETLLSLADALSMSNEGKLIGRPRELVNKAVSLEPQNLTALWLSGITE